MIRAKDLITIWLKYQVVKRGGRRWPRERRYIRQVRRIREGRA